MLEAGGQFVGSLYPPIAVTTEGAQIRDLYTVVFIIAVVIFLVVEGLILWTRHPLSAQADRRQPAAPDPRQQHRRVRLDGRADDHRHLHVHRVLADAQRRRHELADAQTKIRAVAGQFQWQFEYLSPDGNTVLYTENIPLVSAGGGMMVPAGRTVQLQLFVSPKDVIHAFYVPQFLFKRDVVPGRNTSFDFTVDAADAGQTFRGQCAELCGVGHFTMLFEVKALTETDFDAWLADKVAEANATPPPPPSGGPAPSGGAAGETLQVSASGIKYEQSSLTAKAGAPFHIEFENKDQGTPHNVAIHQGSPTGRRGLQGRDLQRRGDQGLRRPGARCRQLRIRVHGPSDDDRHADGPVRSHRWRRPR